MTPEFLNGLPKTPLPGEEEQTLAHKLVDEKSSKLIKNKIRERLVMHSMLEAFFYARKCCRGALPDDELYSLSYSALCRAAVNFQPGWIRFFAYSKVYLRGEICREWKKKDVIKGVPKENLVIWNSDGDDNHNCGVGGHFQYENPKYEFDTVDGKSSKISTGSTATGLDLETQTTESNFNSIHIREIWESLAPLIERKLNPKEQKVIFLRYKQELNFREIGSLIGITRSAAQATHANAILKLRAGLKRAKKIL